MNPEFSREEAEAVQLNAYDQVGDETWFGEGPMEEAFIRFRCQTAVGVLREKGIAPGSLVLDVGCGRGEVTNALVAAGFRAVGCDLALKRLADTKKGQQGSFLGARGQELPLAENSVMAVFAFEVYEHLTPEDATKMLDEFYRVTASGGVLVLSTPNTLSLAGRIKRHFREEVFSRSDHFNEVNYQEIREAVAKAGFRIVESRGVGFFPGMWRVQKLFPSSRLQDCNLRLGAMVPSIASETLIVAQKD